jgi:Ca2+-binding EF-hand superfamily protein
MTKVFNYFDDDSSGYLDFKKLKKMVNECFCIIDDKAI